MVRKLAAALVLRHDKDMDAGLGFGRIVASEIKAPNMLANMV